MKNIFAKALGVAAVAAMTMTSCGDSFLDTDIYDAVDMEGALDNANRVELALNGTYYRFSQYYFAGNYATVTPDIASDITYWNGSQPPQQHTHELPPERDVSVQLSRHGVFDALHLGLRLQSGR